ncbi:AGE family epimerase/isomerase [Gleimia coleocanis]|nr:AGE family epimerase/isomerase [Gleimia coleocanis]
MSVVNALAKDFTPEARAHQWGNLLEFARHSKTETGFGYLLDDATVSTEKPVELWISCRMVHVYSLAWIKEQKPEWKELATHGVHCLQNYFKDHEYGGWYSAISRELNEDGTCNVVDETKAAYAHAFVVLAASSAIIAGIEGGSELLDEALQSQENIWWETDHHKVRESYNRDFTETEAYRGVNANMHTVECYLAAFDATGERLWLDRALDILKWVLDEQARATNWRVAEHYDSNWNPLPEYNIDRPTDPFRPYGHTPGHGLEWGRLALHAGAELDRLGEDIPMWILECADQVIERAIRDGWDADGQPGFVYTTGEDGRPIARERMHWVMCEALGAATTLADALSGASGYGKLVGSEARVTALVEKIDQWWRYANEYLVASPGQWRHELGTENQPTAVTWGGKPDAYHVAQMLLLPDLRLAPTFALGLLS